MLSGGVFGGGAAFGGNAAFDGSAAFGGGGCKLNGGFGGGFGCCGGCQLNGGFGGGFGCCGGGAFACSFASADDGLCSVSGALCTACCVSSSV